MSSDVTRRQVIGSLAGAVALNALGGAEAALAGIASGARPNILFIMADDLGYADLSCYGRREYETPAVDGLAADGIRCLQAYSNSPVCSATRLALMTGRYQYRLPLGLEEPLTEKAPDVGLPPDHPTLPSLLQAAGYRTSLIGKWHLGALPNYGPLKSGYEHFYGFRGGGIDYFTHKGNGAGPDTGDLWDGDTKVEHAGYLTDLLGERAIEEISACAMARKPFMVSLHFSAPHWPWQGPQDEESTRNLHDLHHYDGGSMKTYAAMVTRMDYQIGRVLAVLAKLGLANDTIVVFTSDNGGERFSDNWPFTGRKTELLEGGLRVPAIVRWPARLAGGTTTEQVAMSMDWMPTLLACAGAKSSPDFASDGLNLLPLLKKGAPPIERSLFWRYKANNQYAARVGDWKWLKIRENEFLFNVVQDPMERANLKEKEPDVYARLIQSFKDWEKNMLPTSATSSSGSHSAEHMADRFGNIAPPPMTAPGYFE